MANEYSTLAVLKQQLTIAATDTTRDTLLNQALESASRSIDNLTGRRFFLDAVATARTYNPTGRISYNIRSEQAFISDDIGSTAGLIVEVGVSPSFTVVNVFDTEPDNALVLGRAITTLRLPQGGVWSGGGSDRVRITARWGWPAVPAEVVEATLIQAARLFRRKDSPEGVTGSAEWGVIRLSRVDPDVQALVHHLILPGFG